jgi:hypothetical protein
MLGVRWLGGAAEVWIYDYVPFPKQQFGDVEPIPVLPSPPAQFGGEDVLVSREVQVTDLQLEFGGEDREGRHGTPPMGIAALAHCGADGGSSCHTPG